MDNGANGLADWFLVRHTTDPALCSQSLSRPTGRLAQNTETAVRLPPAPLPPYVSDNVVESVESTNNSPLALAQGVTRATALMHRAMEERAEQERFRREMNRREKEIREQRARERIEREAREMAEANEWPSQQEAIPGPECSLNETITHNIICGYCCRQKCVSRSSAMNTNYGLPDSSETTYNSLPVLEQRVEEACSLGARVLREREEREEFGREIERKEREIREQRARKRREREARELEEASRWPQQQDAITGPWCACRNEGQETAHGSGQGFEALSEPKQETS